MEMGREPTHLAAVIRAILGFDHPQDPEAVELQETIRAEGERAALARYAGVEENHPLVDLVLDSSEPARG
jgi:mannitol-1-phosphate 5-dehydrogenase